MHIIRIPQEVRIGYDGTEQQFIDNADRVCKGLFNDGLDSLDAGDATGFFLNYLELAHDEDDPLNFPDGTTLYYERSTGLFTHEGDWA